MTTRLVSRNFILEKFAIYKKMYLYYCRYCCLSDSEMENIHQIVRLNYTRMFQNVQTDLTFLSDLSEHTDDERFKQSLAEVIYSLNNLSDTISLQRRYLKPGS